MSCGRQVPQPLLFSPQSPRRGENHADPIRSEPLPVVGGPMTPQQPLEVERPPCLPTPGPTFDCPGRDLRQAPLPELLAAPRELRWAPGGRAGARWPVPPMDVHLNTLKPRVPVHRKPMLIPASRQSHPRREIPSLKRLELALDFATGRPCHPLGVERSQQLPKPPVTPATAEWVEEVVEKLGGERHAAGRLPAMSELCDGPRDDGAGAGPVPAPGPPPRPAAAGYVTTPLGGPWHIPGQRVRNLRQCTTPGPGWYTPVDLRALPPSAPTQPHPARRPKRRARSVGTFGSARRAELWSVERPVRDLIILSMTQTAFVLDHEEYVRYGARRAIHQYIYGSVAAPSKATSYAPESFDLARPKPEKVSEEEDQAQLEREFEQEFLERAIAPGPKLDRHPDEEEVLAYQQAMADRKPSSPSGKIEEDSNQPRRKKRKSITPSPKEKANSGGDSPGDSPDGILFKRVALGPQDKKKARVVTVSGDVAEVVTEGDFVSMNVDIGEIQESKRRSLLGRSLDLETSLDLGGLQTPRRPTADDAVRAEEIEETQFGIPVPRRMDQSAPTDFGFMMSHMPPKEPPPSTSSMVSTPAESHVANARLADECMAHLDLLFDRAQD
eukprot:g18390.t1